MKHIIFEYKDKYTHDKWNQQECYVESLKQCIEIYGLGSDCEYKIVLVEDVK